MKKVGAVVVGILVSMVLLPQVALAGTSVHVGISTPNLNFDVSSVRPSPHHVWVEGCHQWNGGRRVWAPGHWRYAPMVRTVYVPAHPQYRDCGYRGGNRGYDRDRDPRGDRYDRHDWENGNGRPADRDKSYRD